MEIVQQILEEMVSIGRTKKTHAREVPVGTAQTEAQINYTGINALLAVEEYSDLGGYTRCQRLRAEPGGVESPQCCCRSEPRMTCLTCAARVSLVLLQPVAVT